MNIETSNIYYNFYLGLAKYLLALITLAVFRASPRRPDYTIKNNYQYRLILDMAKHKALVLRSFCHAPYS